MSTKNEPSKWDKLSTKQRASLIKEYVKNGVRDLGQIKEHYNTFPEVKQDATYMTPELKRVQKPKYTPFIGEIRADDRSKLEKAFDNLATKYNTSNFANSALAEVLAATTPYGLVHEGLGGNKDAVILSIAPFGATLKNGANYAKSLYKGVRGVLDIDDTKVIEALNPKNGITYTNKAEAIPGIPYEYASKLSMAPRATLSLPSPTLAQRRAYEILQNTYNEIYPKKYFNYRSPEEVLVTPRITIRLPYRKNGQYLENKRTGNFLSPYLQLNLADPTQGPTLYNFEDLNKLAQKAYDDSYRMLQYLGKGNETFLSKKEVKDFLIGSTLSKLKQRDPSLQINPYYSIHRGFINNPQEIIENLKKTLKQHLLEKILLIKNVNL